MYDYKIVEQVSRKKKSMSGVLRKIKVNRPCQDKGMDNRKGNEYDSRGNVQIMQT